MNKNVYLFELDSVRKTKEEIERGQQCLYSEIVKNGNCVVITFNQLTDSIVLLKMLENKTYREILTQLFKQGRIKISRYNGYRTASQYLQHAIKENLSQTYGDKFIFSGLPVKSTQKNLLELMNRALQDCDLSEFSEYISDNCSFEKLKELFSDKSNPSQTSELNSEYTTKILIYLKNVLQFILNISMYENAYMSPSSETYTFMDFMNNILKIRTNNSTEEDQLFNCSICYLNILRENFYKSAKPQQSGSTDIDSYITKRSFWLDIIKKDFDSQKNKHTSLDKRYQMAELIVNLCYNYKVESSIANVSKHYELSPHKKSIASFEDDFLRRLWIDWKNGKNADKRFLQEEGTELVEQKIKYPHWKRALRLTQNIKQSTPTPNSQAPLYEYNYHKEAIFWRLILIGKSLLKLLVIALFIFMIGILSNIIDHIIKPENIFFSTLFISTAICFFIAEIAGDRLEYLINRILYCINQIFKSNWYLEWNGIYDALKSIFFIVGDILLILANLGLILLTIGNSLLHKLLKILQKSPLYLNPKNLNKHI